MAVAALLSGGVDSSVALKLLLQSGHKPTAFYLKIWLEDELSYLGQCPWEEDLAYVRAICERSNVPLEIVPMQKEYWERVVDYVVREAKAGRTPNPDILCNQQIKFGQFYEKMGSGFGKVATGHYAQVSEEGGVFFLKRSPDAVKDQTYFLARLSQEQLSRALFPIGHLTKKEVRALAREFDLPNQARKDSQGICFLGKIPFREFLKHHLGEKPGKMVDMENGQVLGEHAGYWFYTIGQRHGLGLSGGPFFVAQKDVTSNTLFLAKGYGPEAVKADRFAATEFHWISEAPPAGIPLTVKIRHGASEHACTLLETDGVLTVHLKEPVHGVAPGQFAVFYSGDVCLGSAVIALP